MPPQSSLLTRRRTVPPHRPSANVTFPRRGEVTFEHFVAVIHDGEKADLLDGVIYMASPDNTVANDLNTWLTILLGDFIAQQDLGTLFISRVAYRLDEHNGPEPDLGFVARRNTKRIARGHVLGGPDLAVEIVSPDSVLRDYEHKRRQYESAGVREYWIIDPDEQRATFLRLSRGRYQKVTLEDGRVFHSSVLPGLSLDTRWLWMKRRPAASRLVTHMLKTR